jgi:glycerol-3-phosphate acyltransferase PlsY
MSSPTWMIFLGSYLLGSIPFAYLVTRLATGDDIRHLGDGNVGAKNTYQSVGKTAGLVVAAADVGKGAIAVTVAGLVSSSEAVIMLAGACVILGHDFPVFLHFRGGQGMAAMVGVFAVIFPQQVLVAVCVLAVAFLLTRNWDLSCAAGFVSLIALLWIGGVPAKRVFYAMLLLPSIGLKKLLQRWQVRRVLV